MKTLVEDEFEPRPQPMVSGMTYTSGGTTTNVSFGWVLTTDDVPREPYRTKAFVEKPPVIEQ